MAFEREAKLYIVDKSLKIIKIIKIKTFVSLVFSFSAAYIPCTMDSSHFSLNFISILSTN
jgi:hypothetical protein